jgi:hypothetical protein
MDMEDDPIRLRMIAATCRRLVSGISDAVTIARVTPLADGCEARLRALTERFDGYHRHVDPND